MNNELIGIITNEGELAGEINDDGLSVNVTIVGTGEQGEIGKSAYQEWLDLGNVGSEEDFLLSLEGQDGYTPQKGIDYFDGEKGDKGDIGPEGPQGDKGDVGPQGPKGDKGDTGPQGKQGIQGPQGDKGDTGEQGIQGEKGDTGEQGPRGLQGPKGDPFVYDDFTPTQLEGLKGPQGIQGPKGDKGDTGEQGPQGNDGYTPIKGIDYFDGEKGVPGEDGSDATVTNSNITDALGYTPANATNEHTHSNKVVIDKFTEVDNKPYYNGAEIGGAVPNLTLNELILGGRYKITYNDIEDSLDIEVI